MSGVRVWQVPLLVLMMTAMVGCATLTADLDPPKISLESLKALPSEGSVPRFEIKLRVINPNKQTLDIAGVSYSVELLDREVMTGVTNNVQPIEGYGEGIVTLEAGIQLLELLRLMASLGQASNEPLVYKFTAKVDFHGLMPTQRLEESGELKLN